MMGYNINTVLENLNITLEDVSNFLNENGIPFNSFYDNSISVENYNLLLDHFKKPENIKLLEKELNRRIEYDKYINDYYGFSIDTDKIVISLKKTILYICTHQEI